MERDRIKGRIDIISHILHNEIPNSCDNCTVENYEKKVAEMKRLVWEVEELLKTE